MHHVRNRKSATAYNAFTRMNTSLYDVDGFVLENNVADHVDASNTSAVDKGVFMQGNASTHVRGFVSRNNVWPDNLVGAHALFDLPQYDVEFLIDETVMFDLAGGVTVDPFYFRVAPASITRVAIEATAFDGTAEEGAAYRKEALYRSDAGTMSAAGSISTLTEIEDDAAWDFTYATATNLIRVWARGDGTNNTRWRAHIKAESVRPSGS